MKISLGRATGKVVTRIRQASVSVSYFYIADLGIGELPVEDIIKKLFGPSVRFID